MTLVTGNGMAEGGKGADDSRGTEFVAVNGHIDSAVGSTDFAASILGHPSTILIVTNVADATFVSTEARVSASVAFILSVLHS